MLLALQLQEANKNFKFIVLSEEEFVESNCDILEKFTLRRGNWRQRRQINWSLRGVKYDSIEECIAAEENLFIAQ